MAKHIAPGNPAQINLIAAGTELEGTLNAKDDTRVSGKLKGTLRVDGKAIIAQEGSVEGEVHAANADVAGHLLGGKSPSKVFWCSREQLRSRVRFVLRV